MDIGAGFGELGVVTKAEGHFEYVGFEPSQSVSAVARRRGVPIRTQMFDPGDTPEQAGAVILDNVIEHVVDPVGLIKDAVSALRPGGVLVVIVPNRHDVRQIIPAWRIANHWIPPEHINYFTVGSLREAICSSGLTMKPFGFAALGRDDWQYLPRAILEKVGVYPFGLNMFGLRTKDTDDDHL